MIVTAVLLLALAVAVAVIRTRQGKQKWNLPPSPDGVPLLGHLPLLASHPDTYNLLAGLAKQLGPLFHLKLGDMHAVVISSEEIAREAMLKRGGNFAGRWPLHALWFLTGQGQDMAFAPPGEHWRKLKRAANQLMGNGALSSFDSALDSLSRRVVDYVYEHSAKSQTAIDMSGLYYFFTSSTIVLKALGIQFESPDDPELHNLRRMARKMIQLSSVGGLEDYFPVDLPNEKRSFVSRWMHKTLYAVLSHAKRKHLQRLEAEYLHGFIMKRLLEIERTVKHEDEGTSLETCYAEQLIRNTDKLDLTMEQIMHFMSTIILGGVDTTGAELEWTMLLLSTRPDVQRKAHEELARVTGGHKRLPELSDMPEMPYMRAILKEVLRFQPALNLGVPRVAIEQCQLAGYDIPAGTQVILNVPAIHQDSFAAGSRTGAEFPLDEFHPERFVTPADEADSQSGRRLCPGLHLAYRELFMVVSRLVFAFELKAQDKHGKLLTNPSLEGSTMIVCRPVQEYKVQAIARMPHEELVKVSNRSL
ncbi:hypothetical protein RI367_006107 [Sorochytrium milnesiophthora]